MGAPPPTPGTPGRASGEFKLPSPMAMLGKGAPAPQDYQALNAQQTRANRPSQSTPFGTSTWSQGKDGQWTQNVQFGGPLAGAFGNVSQQAADAMGKPLDFSGLPQLQYGEDARKAAVDSAYNQATSRLDPMWGQREDAERTRLINQGLDPSSEAYRGAMGDFGRGRNDAYTSAMNMAIGRGAEDSRQMFDQSAMARQMSLGEMLTGRNQPLRELGAFQDMLRMPSFNSATGGVEAAQMSDLFKLKGQEMESQQLADIIGGATGGIQGLGKALMMLFGGGAGGGGG